MEYADQSANALVLNIFDKPIDMEQFTILTEGHIANKYLEVEAVIIGESHAVSIKREGKFICEVFSCGTVNADDKPEFKLVDPILGSPLDLDLDGFQYHFKSSLMKLECKEKEKIREMENQIVFIDCSLCLGLKFGFPCDEVSGVVPKTIVMVGLKEQEVFIESVHSYPNKNEVVFTETSIVNLS